MTCKKYKNHSVPVNCYTCWARIVCGSPATIHSCSSASLGVMRELGSHYRQRCTRFTNFRSQSGPRIAFQLIASLIFSLFLTGGMRGEKSYEKNFFLLYARYRSEGEGTPRSSMNISICSF